MKELHESLIDRARLEALIHVRQAQHLEARIVDQRALRLGDRRA